MGSLVPADLETMGMDWSDGKTLPAIMPDGCLLSPNVLHGMGGTKSKLAA